MCCRHEEWCRWVFISFSWPFWRSRTWELGAFHVEACHGFLGFLSSNNNGMVLGMVFWPLLCPRLSMWLAPLVPKLQQQITSVSSKLSHDFAWWCKEFLALHVALPPSPSYWSSYCCSAKCNKQRSIEKNTQKHTHTHLDTQ